MNDTNKTPISHEEMAKQIKEYREKERKKAIMFVITFLLICTFGCVYGLITIFGDSSNSNNATKGNSSYNNLNTSCYYYSQRLVKEKLKSPKSAEFPKYSADFISRDGDTVTVSAYVNAENSFGATVKTNYIATIQLKNNEPVSGSVVLIE